jgi:hypothetical protein
MTNNIIKEHLDLGNDGESVTLLHGGLSSVLGLYTPSRIRLPNCWHCVSDRHCATSSPPVFLRPDDLGRLRPAGQFGRRWHCVAGSDRVSSQAFSSYAASTSLETSVRAIGS